MRFRDFGGRTRPRQWLISNCHLATASSFTGGPDWHESRTRSVPFRLESARHDRPAQTEPVDVADGVEVRGIVRDGLDLARRRVVRSVNASRADNHRAEIAC